MDPVLDVIEDNGQAKQIAYSGFITTIVKKHKGPMQILFEIVYDSVDTDDNERDEKE